MAGTAGGIIGLGILIVCYLGAWEFVPRGKYTFEHRGPGSFEPTLARYDGLVKFIVGLATGSIAIVTGTSLFRNAGSVPQIMGSPLVLLAMSVVFFVMFLGLTSFFYEDWLHHQNQTHHKYRISVALGFAGLLCFAAGYFMLAFALVGHGK